MNSLSEGVFVERQFRIYDGINRLIDFCIQNQNEFLYNLRDFGNTKTEKQIHDNIIIFVAYNLLKNGVITEEFYKDLIEISYEHAGFQLLIKLSQQDYFEGDSEIITKIDTLITFYLENFRTTIEDTTQNTQKNALIILEGQSANWLLGEVQDMIYIVTNILKGLQKNFSTIKEIQIPEYLQELPKKMYLTKIINTEELNYLQGKLSKTDTILSFVGQIIFFLLNTGRLDLDEKVHQSACIYMKLLTRNMLPSDGNILSEHVGKIMEKYSEKKHLEKIYTIQSTTRKKIYTGFLENAEDFAGKNIPLIYQFLGDLENLGYILPVQHIRLLKEKNLSNTLAQGILFSLEAGEYESPGIAVKIIKGLNKFFNDRGLSEECERVQCLRNIF
ncbi:hypothetical protein LAT59_00305 [Candidatus Gracilibacteria bacterium]|nr:hypothetical protein [Candidatus Gracilibacteria bacterium]